MANKMLIDATHPEETRVVVVRGNQVEEFDFETANRKQLRGNIYLAKVTRVEPSLQAAFVEYGGNRHGFLAFSEIHPDYYQIPIADREALLAEEQREQADFEADNRSHRRARQTRGAERDSDFIVSESSEADGLALRGINQEAAEISSFDDVPTDEIEEQPAAITPAPEIAVTGAAEGRPRVAADDEVDALVPQVIDEGSEPDRAFDAVHEYEPQAPMHDIQGEAGIGDAHTGAEDALIARDADHAESHDDGPAEEEQIESIGGADVLEEVQERVPRFRRQYKIQEVIKRRQVLLVQVVKEERGSKGAALTTYLSLAGRYCVLMPNTARGGGISRKITSAEDRARLKEIVHELEVPEGMGVILRTAGASRTKAEVKRDFEYLLRLWETVRDTTLKSVAPKLVHEESSLTKRSIRDLYTQDIDEIIVAGEEGFNEARDFMRMLMPSHAKNVKLYKDGQPLFTRYGVESQLDAMFSPVVQLRSGGYIVINQAEALVAIDVNSGRATREHHIEDTALKTNIEAAEEIARQLRLRDLAGLIVIDFIDMDEGRNNRAVERRLKEALKHDRARIQVGRISHFGLLEMSRQRIRSSVLESSTEKCPICGGSGHVRSVSSVALQLLRAIEEMLIKGATHNLTVRTRSEVALYVLNHKRAHLRELEERFHVTVTVSADATVSGQQSYVIDRGEQVHTLEAAKSFAVAARRQSTSPIQDGVDVYEDAETHADRAEVVNAGSTPEGEIQSQSSGDRRRRRRGRRRGGEIRESHESQDEAVPFTHCGVAEHASAPEDHDASSSSEEGPMRQSASEDPVLNQSGEERRRRRRGRRGGRRNRRRNGDRPFGGDESDVQPTNHPMQHPLVSDEDASAIAPSFDPGQATTENVSAAAPAQVLEESASSASMQGTSRRRSTIREPASRTNESTSSAPASPPPSPAPIISSTNPEPAVAKRGWWGRRLLGDKN
jgi:ribonuclease E